MSDSINNGNLPSQQSQPLSDPHPPGGEAAWGPSTLPHDEETEQQQQRQQRQQQQQQQHDDANEEEGEWVEITAWIEACAASLTVQEPWVCRPESFSLHDAMAATQLMDAKMDGCEIPAAWVAPYRPSAVNSSSTTESIRRQPPPTNESAANSSTERMVFPRPVPISLTQDPFTPIPWTVDTLTLSDAAYMLLEMMVRLQSLLMGASVGESTYTCLYAQAAVLSDMYQHVLPEIRESLSANDNALATSVTTDPTCTQPLNTTSNGPIFPKKEEEDNTAASTMSANKVTPAQCVVLAATAALVDLTEIVRGIMINADIYEEEDFAMNTHNISAWIPPPLHATSSGSRPLSSSSISTATFLIEKACAVLSSLPQDPSSPTFQNHSDDVAILVILAVLNFFRDFTSICTLLGRITSEELESTVELTRRTIHRVQENLEQLRPRALKLQECISDSNRAALHYSFDSFVNRPLVGNAPVRKVSFLAPTEAIPILIKIMQEMEWSVCDLLCHADSLGRVRRMLDRVTRSEVNILSRSLIVLNLYFDEKLLGQFSLRQMIIDHMTQLMYVPDDFLAMELTKAYLDRLAKPVYDTLKLRTLNPNRQRAYIEVAMLPDWIAMQADAHLIDVHYRRENGLDSSTQPILSQYVMSALIQLMDRYIASGLEMKLFCSHQELSMAFWYRDFLLSALTNTLTMMMRSKVLARASLGNGSANVPSNNNGGGTSHKGPRGKKKNQNPRNKSNGKPHPAASSVHTSIDEDTEDKFELAVLTLMRNLCRGLVRFLAALRQASLLPTLQYEFTSIERIYEKRFEAFGMIRHPPALPYSHYLEGSDVSGVDLGDLIPSTAEWFQSCKKSIDHLLAEINQSPKAMNPMHLSTPAEELRSLIKVCVGNSVYLHKLRQQVVPDSASPTTPARTAAVQWDFDDHAQFCTLKLTSPGS